MHPFLWLAKQTVLSYTDGSSNKCIFSLPAKIHKETDAEWRQTVPHKTTSNYKVTCAKHNAGSWNNEF